MDVREKLVEILLQEDDLCERGECKDCFANGSCYYYREADRLIANGITVQEWISVKEHLPQENEPEGTLCETVQVLLNNGKVSVGWCNRITKLWYHMDYDKDYYTSNDYDHTPVIAWMPLAHPPKGE